MCTPAEPRALEFIDRHEPISQPHGGERLFGARLERAHQVHLLAGAARRDHGHFPRFRHGTHEFDLEVRGDKTVIRVVTSGFGTASAWDSEVDSISCGWLGYLRLLRFSPERHRGADRQVAYGDVKLDLPAEAAWRRLLSAAALAREGSPGGAHEGGRAALVSADGDRLSGEVQVWNPQKDLAITIADWNDAHPWPEFYPAPRASVAKLTLSTFGLDEAKVRDTQTRWRRRLAEMMFIQQADTQPLFGYGVADAGGRRITFEVPMDIPMAGLHAVPMRTVLDLSSPDTCAFEMNAPMPDGSEFRPVRIDYVRAK